MIEKIYGFLIVSPITLSASVAVSLILGWVSLKHAERVGMIFGRQACSCRGAQCDMFPKIQIYVVLPLQCSSYSKPVNSCGKIILTP